MAEAYAPRGVSIPIVSVDKLIQQELDAENSLLDINGKNSKKVDLDALTGFIVKQFNTNKDAKYNSGIEDEILDSVRAFNGEYSSGDLSKISSEGGSNIFMNITATKSRCAKSWLSDIFLPAKGKAWSLEPSPSESVPDDIRSSIEAAINQEFQELASGSADQPTSAEQSQQIISETNQTKRDVVLSIAEEVHKEAKFQLLTLEKEVEDQLNLGKFSQALLTFLEDICIYPCAIMKGPVICKKPKIYWEGGKPKTKDSYYFMNERVDPLDIYPSPDATSVQDGNLIEHLRLSPSSLGNLKGIKGYNTEAIDEVLTQELYGNSWLDTGSIEQEKADEEFRGDVNIANENVVHGLHFFGPVPYGTVLEWNPSFKIKDSDVKLEPQDLVEVEAIVAGGKTIKCSANGDPLKRRPYYKASYMNRPGSFWGRSLPSLMSDIQKMCNAAARAIANNMALGSGPMVEVYVDRLADSGSLTEMKPRQIWQTIPDPTGAGGRAIDFFQPALVADQLILIYEKFEQKADDVTGIPAYAYGNDKTATAPTTVGGLSLILESTSKIIKDCVRNIDEGLVKPRIEYQFYWNLLYNPRDFSGDIEVVPRASSVLTTKSSEALRRQEFLQITANQFDQQVMGIEGRTEILRVMAEDLGLPGDVMPSRLTVKRQQKAMAANEQAIREEQRQLEEMKANKSIEATTVQVSGQERMHQSSLALNKEKLDRTTELDKEKLQLIAADKSLTHKLRDQEIQTGLAKQESINKINEDNNLREVALKLQGSTGI